MDTYSHNQYEQIPIIFAYPLFIPSRLRALGSILWRLSDDKMNHVMRRFWKKKKKKSVRKYIFEKLNR